MSKSHSTNRTVTWLLNIVKLIGLFALYQLAMIPTMMPAIRHGFSATATLIAGVASLVLLGSLIWWLVTIYRRQAPIVTSLSRPTRPVLTIVGLFILVELGNVLAGLIVKQTPENQVILDKVFTTSPVINVVMMAVLAPIVEELIFRGLMYRWLFPRVTNWVSFTVALVFSSLVFALAHTLSFSPALLAYLPIAVVLTFTYVWFNDIRYSIALHIINNSLAMVGMLTLLSR
ncbi:CPBP family intramembrane metalloprotease [Lactiplantibacillus plantarum]|uniref:CPBP family intramembrane glutamic endopeptidase n=1 Tax=Lactiplantibacillus plantarum TaxID=1590 RepID=UPI000398755B|nr:CPBP family intramembrane glutamic endopeptidase [Lactiplantibacillus plantarum]ERJ52665.1 CAAX amino terminal protease [Lactiplantibacillus plantarum 2165]MBA2820330.1 hypothetical protein [Lactiplantibacillus plantarum]PTV23686.1 CPBP family intramembrane metalloprotease [Lactiplantibacillus plantarum]PTV27074.1 CPBP family intramembrane metalloprotease [Lactiplantibacillus plantarum]